MEKITEKRIMDALSGLEPGRWAEVLDFIGYLKEKQRRERAMPGTRALTARELLSSAIVGLWADRDDMGDSPGYARRLRCDAEHRRRVAE
ncbi:MAG: hypothetical protein JXA74_11695 [Anaerolineae bacterium]|nr:hypothetical protein [Anaerolineae bacterium]